MKWGFLRQVSDTGSSLMKRRLMVAGAVAVVATAVLAVVLSTIADATAILDRVGWAGLASVAVTVFGLTWLTGQMRANSMVRSAPQISGAAVVVVIGLVGLAQYGWPLVTPKTPGPTGEPHPPGSSNSHPAKVPVAAVTSYAVVGGRSGWIVPDRGDDSIRYISSSTKPSSEAVFSSGGAVTVTVQGLTGKSVVLQSMEVDVDRRSPPMSGIYLPVGTQGEVPPRKYRLNLDATEPKIVPAPDTVPFPYKVNEVEPEQFVITPEVATGDVEWRLILRWTSGADKGVLVLPESGGHFRTTATTAARKFCFDFNNRVWRPSC
jgi:hypothetical protein